MFSVISSMILSRYFSKVDYGTYKQIMYVYTSLLVVFSLGIPKTYSFFLPRLPIEEARSSIKKINLILFGSGLVMSLTIYLAAELIANLLRNPNLAQPLRYFALVPTFLMPTIGLGAILSTFRKTQLIAVYNIVTKTFMLLSVVFPVVFFNGGIDSAIIGFTVSSCISFILSHYLRFYPLKGVESQETTLKYKELFGYALPLFYAGIWGVIIASSDQFFISRYFGTEAFAEFANGSLELPFVGMVVGAASIVLSPIYSKKAFEGTENAKNEIIRLWRSVFKKTVALIYPMVAFFIIFAEAVMTMLYGEVYASSGEYFQIKLLVNFFTLMTYGPLIVSIGGQKFYYKVHMYGALILIAIQSISVVLIHNPIAIVWVSVLCHIGRILAMLIFIADYFDLSLYKLFPWKTIIKISPCFLILLALKTTIFSYLTAFNLFLSLLITGLLYVIIFLGWSVICKMDYWSIIKPFIKKT